MRKHRTTATSFTGQLLFAEIGPDAIVLDCLLARPGSTASSLPVTLKAAWPAGTPADEVTEVLERWADEGEEITVVITEGLKGPSVEIATESTRVILVPEG